jgi:hypothetical protein
MKPRAVCGLAALAGASQALLIPADVSRVMLPDTQDGMFALSYDDNNQAVITTIQSLDTDGPANLQLPAEDSDDSGSDSNLNTELVQMPLSKRWLPNELPVKRGDFGCRSEACKQLDSIPDYTSGRRLLGKECDHGAHIGGYNAMWVRKGTAYAYTCNYSERPNTCSSAEINKADEILNQFCPQVSEEVARKSTGWVHMAEWKKTYGRGKFGDVICGNLPRLNGGRAAPVGNTENLGMAHGDYKRIGGYVQKIMEWVEYE